MASSKKKKAIFGVIFIFIFIIAYFAYYSPKKEKEQDPLIMAEEYIMSLRNVDGGFGPDPKTGNSTIESTAYAVLALKELGRLKSLNKTILEGIYNFTLNQQRWDGGFGNDITYDYSTLYHTYLAIRCLDTFNRTFILNNQYLGSYFADQFYADGSAGDIVDTFYAIDGMKLMNVSKYVWNKYTENTEFFVKSLYVLPGGFSSNMFDDKPYVYSTYFSLMVMIDLGLYETDFDKEIINNSTRWVVECFDDVTGGFGNRKGRETVLDVTYWAVRSLNYTKQLFGAAPWYKKEMVEPYIMACQREDGGFVKSPDSKEKTSIMWTYYAFAALNQVHPVSQIQAEKLEVVQIQTAFFLIMAVAVIIIVGKPWKPLLHGQKRQSQKRREKMLKEQPFRKKTAFKHQKYFACETCRSVIRQGILYKCQTCGKLVCERHMLNCGCNYPDPVEFAKLRKKLKKRMDMDKE